MSSQTPHCPNIGLIGFLGSGKTTVARMLEGRYGYRRIPFARPLKRVSAAMVHAAVNTIWEDYGIEPETLDLYDARWGGAISPEYLDEHKEVFRTLLQWVGTDLCRDFLYDDKIWIRIMEQQLDRAAAEFKPVVIDDVRFPNEVEFLKERGFTIVRVMRPEADREATIHERGESLESMGHASEGLTALVEHYGIYAESLDELWNAAAGIAHGSLSHYDLLGGACVPHRFGGSGVIDTEGRSPVLSDR